MRVFDRYGSSVYHVAASALGGSADADDVTQATLLAAWLGRETFDPDRGSLLGWLLAIARRKVVDRIRALTRERRIVDTSSGCPTRRRSTPTPTAWSTGWSWPTNWPACPPPSAGYSNSPSTTT